MASMLHDSRLTRPRRHSHRLAAIALAAGVVHLHLNATAVPAWISGGKTAPLRPARLASQAVSTFGATSVAAQNALEQLRGISAVVPDKFAFRDFDEAAPKFTLASSRTILEALESGVSSSLADLVERAMSNEKCAIEWDVLEEGQGCFEESLVTLVGKDLLDRLPSFARVSTELPLSTLSSPAAAVRSGQRILEMYRELGVDADRVLLRVPANVDGLRAAAALSRAGLQAHVTNVYSVQQAALAKEAGAAAIQVYVGRIDEAGGDGVALARQIYRVLKSGGGKTPALVAASLRSVSQVSALSGADYMLVSPEVLQELREMPGLNLDPEGGILGGALSDPSLSEPAMSGFLLSPVDFEVSLPPLAKELLKEGVEKNLKEQAALQKLIADAKQFL